MDPMTDSWTHTGYAQQLLFGAGRRATPAGRAAPARPPAGDAGRRRTGRASPVTARPCSACSAGRSHRRSPVCARTCLPPRCKRRVRQARRDAVDAVVSFGGGSCADLGKAVCWFTEQAQGTPGGSWADRPVLPHVSIPTTYSGAELTPFFGMTDPATGQKSGAGGPTTAPLAAIYDPELTLSTPARVSAETGMNALAHCVEVGVVTDQDAGSRGDRAGRRSPDRRCPSAGRRRT